MLFIYIINFLAFTGGQTAHKHSKYIAVVADSIVCCHTAPARRREVARVRGNPVIFTIKNLIANFLR